MFGLILVALSSKTKSVAARLLELRVIMTLTEWMFFSCVFVCRVDGGLCYELTIRSEESYRVCVWVCACVIGKPQQWGFLDPRWANAPQKKTRKEQLWISSLHNFRHGPISFLFCVQPFSHSHQHIILKHHPSMLYRYISFAQHILPTSLQVYVTSFIQQCVLRQVQSTFQKKLST